MATRKKILEITYHSDDDTGMYEIGEVDCGLGEDLTRYLKNYGSERLIDYLQRVLPKRIKHYEEFRKRDTMSAGQSNNSL